MHANVSELRARLARYCDERPDLVAVIRDATPVERPRCGQCRDRGWYYIDVGREWPERELCRRCADELAYDRWGHVLVEAPAGDVNDHGDYVGDAA